ncbi:MAG: cytochrome c oxidase assembly protein [Planctomycetaceae bacterium]|nr:cytochrome c oxidase assembly protein [Planctomycetaceae bacterium]
MTGGRDNRRSRGVLAGAAALVLFVARPAWADSGGPIGWWQGWNWDPVLLLNLAILWWLYGRGLTRLWRRGGVGRGIGLRQPIAFLTALATLFVALVSPLDALSGELASAHMVQHLLLILVAAPLFVVAAPMPLILGGLPKPLRREVGRWRQRIESGPAGFHLLWNPLFVWIAHAMDLWVWHVPALYESALRRPVVHDLEHLTFFGTACLFWRVLLDPISGRRLNPAAAVLSLFTMSLQGRGLGALMALSPHPWYGAYAGTASTWRLTPLEDQQLAGLIMWMPGGLIYALASVLILGAWLSGPDGGGRVSTPLSRIGCRPSAT